MQILTPDVLAQFRPAIRGQTGGPSVPGPCICEHPCLKQCTETVLPQNPMAWIWMSLRGRSFISSSLWEKKRDLYCYVEVYIFSWEKNVPYAALQKAVFPLEIHIELTKRKNKYLWGKPACLSTLHLQVACRLQHIHSPSENLALVFLVARLSKSFFLWQPTRIAKEHSFPQLVIFANLSEMKFLHTDFVDTTESSI